MLNIKNLRGKFTHFCSVHVYVYREVCGQIRMTVLVILLLMWLLEPQRFFHA